MSSHGIEQAVLALVADWAQKGLTSKLRRQATQAELAEHIRSLLAGGQVQQVVASDGAQRLGGRYRWQRVDEGLIGEKNRPLLALLIEHGLLTTDGATYAGTAEAYFAAGSTLGPWSGVIQGEAYQGALSCLAGSTFWEFPSPPSLVGGAYDSALSDGDVAIWLASPEYDARRYSGALMRLLIQTRGPMRPPIVEGDPGGLVPQWDADNWGLARHYVSGVLTYYLIHLSGFGVTAWELEPDPALPVLCAYRALEAAGGPWLEEEEAGVLAGLRHKLDTLGYPVRHQLTDTAATASPLRWGWAWLDNGAAAMAVHVSEQTATNGSGYFETQERTVSLDLDSMTASVTHGATYRLALQKQDFPLWVPTAWNSGLCGARYADWLLGQEPNVALDKSGPMLAANNGQLFKVLEYQSALRNTGGTWPGGSYWGPVVDCGTGRHVDNFWVVGEGTASGYHSASGTTTLSGGWSVRDSVSLVGTYPQDAGLMERYQLHVESGASGSSQIECGPGYDTCYPSSGTPSSGCGDTVRSHSRGCGPTVAQEYADLQAQYEGTHTVGVRQAHVTTRKRSVTYEQATIGAGTEGGSFALLSSTDVGCWYLGKVQVTVTNGTTRRTWDSDEVPDVTDCQFDTALIQNPHTQVQYDYLIRSLADPDSYTIHSGSTFDGANSPPSGHGWDTTTNLPGSTEHTGQMYLVSTGAAQELSSLPQDWQSYARVGSSTERTAVLAWHSARGATWYQEAQGSGLVLPVGWESAPTDGRFRGAV